MIYYSPCVWVGLSIICLKLSRCNSLMIMLFDSVRKLILKSPATMHIWLRSIIRLMWDISNSSAEFLLLRYKLIIKTWSSWLCLSKNEVEYLIIWCVSLITLSSYLNEPSEYPTRPFPFPTLQNLGTKLSNEYLWSTSFLWQGGIQVSLKKIGFGHVECGAS